MCRSEACLPVAAVLPPVMPFPRPRTQPMKPKLPRKLATSARINLNKYWHALEELMPVSCRALDECDSNAINENLDNERRLAAMRLCDTPGVGNTAGGSTTSVFNTLGKNSSYLQTSTASSNVLLDTKSSSGSSSMNVDESSSFSKATSSSDVEPSCFLMTFPDENTPPLNGSPISGNAH